jgi:hypothetical protein
MASLQGKGYGSTISFGGQGCRSSRSGLAYRTSIDRALLEAASAVGRRSLLEEASAVSRRSLLEGVVDKFRSMALVDLMVDRTRKVVVALEYPLCSLLVVSHEQLSLFQCVIQ